MHVYADPTISSFYFVYWASRLCGPAGWLAILRINADDVATNPGPTTTRKQV